MRGVVGQVENTRNIYKLKTKMKEIENKTKCLRCGKQFVIPIFIELKDTSNGKTFRICEKCGEELVKWLTKK